MRITSHAQADAFARGAMPPVEEVGPGVFAVPLAMPNPRLPYSLSYLLEGDSGELHVIDTGIDSEENWTDFVTAVEKIGHHITDVASLSLTHMHVDHTGLAARLRAVAGSTVRMHAQDAAAMRNGAVLMDDEVLEASLRDWAVPAGRHEELRRAAGRRAGGVRPFDVDEVFISGQTLRIADRELRVLHSPGHTTGHVVIVDDANKLLFSGDHVLPRINPGIGLGGRSAGDDPIGECLGSLQLVASLGDFEVCPGHGYRFTGLAGRCSSIAEHHHRRTREVGAMLGDCPDGTVWAIARRLTWTAGWANLRGPHLLSALAQTAMHIRRSRSSPTSLTVPDASADNIPTNNVKRPSQTT